MQQTVYQPISSASLHCPFNSPWSFFCFTKTCQNSALLCGNAQCPCTSSHHKNCSICFGNPILQHVQSRRKHLSGQVDSALQEIEAIYNEMIEKLSMEREKLQLTKAHGGLSQQQIVFLDALQGRRFGDVTGDLISKVKEKTEKKVTAFKGLNKDYVKKIWKGNKDIFQNIVSQLSAILKPDSDFDQLKTQKPTSKSSGDIILMRYQSQIKELQQSTKHKEMQLQNYRQQIYSLKIRLNDQQKQLNDTQGHSKDIRKFNDSPDSKAHILTQQVRQLQDALMDMKERYMRSQERIDILQNENKQLRKKVDGNTDQTDQHNTIAKLQKQIQIMKSEVQILQQNLMSKDMLLKMETRRCEELKTQITRR